MRVTKSRSGGGLFAPKYRSIKKRCRERRIRTSFGMSWCFPFWRERQRCTKCGTLRCFCVSCTKKNSASQQHSSVIFGMRNVDRVISSGGGTYDAACLLFERVRVLPRNLLYICVCFGRQGRGLRSEEQHRVNNLGATLLYILDNVFQAFRGCRVSDNLNSVGAGAEGWRFESVLCVRVRAREIRRNDFDSLLCGFSATPGVSRTKIATSRGSSSRVERVSCRHVWHTPEFGTAFTGLLRRAVNISHAHARTG